MDLLGMKKNSEKRVSIGCQTNFTENETQTMPWTPNYKVIQGEPEVLKLSSFEWEKGLPAKRHEVDTILRMRKQRAWENYVGAIYSPDNVLHRHQIITDVEKNENLKVALKHSKVNLKYHKLTPHEEYCNPRSDFHINIARFGKNPRYRSENLTPECKSARLEVVREVQSSLYVKDDKHYNIHSCKEKLKPVSAEDFELLEACDDVTKSLETENSDRSFVMPVVFNDFEELNAAVTYIQRYIRGRTTQKKVEKDLRRDLCFIEELKTSETIFEDEDIRALAMRRYRNYYHLMKKAGSITIIANELTSQTISEISDFSAKELIRFQDEIKIRSLVNKAEGTRWRREAIESGRRQMELRKMREYDEIYLRSWRMNEITSGFYLNAIAKSAIESASLYKANEKTNEFAIELDDNDKEYAEIDHSLMSDKEIIAKIKAESAFTHEKDIYRRGILDCETLFKDKITEALNLTSFYPDENEEIEEEEQTSIISAHESIESLRCARFLKQKTFMKHPSLTNSSLCSSEKASTRNSASCEEVDVAGLISFRFDSDESEEMNTLSQSNAVYLFHKYFNQHFKEKPKKKEPMSVSVN